MLHLHWCLEDSGQPNLVNQHNIKQGVPSQFLGTCVGWFHFLPVLHDEVVAVDCVCEEQVVSSGLTTVFCTSGI